MAVRVKFFSCFEDLIREGRAEVCPERATLAGVIDSLDASFPGFKDKLLAEDSGKLRIHYQAAINRDFVRELAAPVNDGDEVVFLMPIAGG